MTPHRSWQAPIRGLFSRRQPGGALGFDTRTARLVCVAGGLVWACTWLLPLLRTPQAVAWDCIVGGVSYLALPAAFVARQSPAARYFLYVLLFSCGYCLAGLAVFGLTLLAG